MIQILFKNLEPSQLAREATLERVGAIALKFPDLAKGKVRVTLEMQNSPLKPGPDVFTVKLHVPSGRYRGLTVAKSEPNMYVALAEVVEHMLEKLNRFGDKERVRARSKARSWTPKREPESEEWRYYGDPE